MKKSRLFYSLFLLVILVSSCQFTAPLVQYTPSMVNAASIHQKGDFKGTALYTTGRDPVNDFYNNKDSSNYLQNVNGFQAQGAYAVKDGIVLLGSFAYSGEFNKTIVDNIKTSYDYKRNMFELGLAFNHKIESSKKWFTSLSVGAGIGKNTTTENSNSLSLPAPYYNHNIVKIYLLPALYYQNKNFRSFMGIRGSFLNFNRVATTYTDLQKTEKGLFPGTASNNFTLDFCFQTAYYLPKVPGLGFTAQFLLAQDMTKKMNNNLNNINFGMGTVFLLHAKKD